MATLGSHSPTHCPHCNGILPARFGAEPLPAACPICQRPLAAEHFKSPQAQAEGLRSAVERQKSAQMERERWRDQQRAERANLERQFRDELIDEGILSGNSHSLVVMVPSLDAATSPLPDERKQKFLDRLTKLAKQVFADSDARGQYVLYEETGDYETTTNPLHNQVPIAACSTCRGYCCMGGGEHAFFDFDSLAFRAEQHGIESVEEVIHTYRELLPEQTITDSCVFHTDRGCNIPRDLRAFTCNSFVCAGLDDFLSKPPASDITEIAIVSQHDGKRLRETVVRPEQAGDP